MTATTWGDIAKGDRVELGGKVYTVTKAKAVPGQGGVRVEVERNGKKHRDERRATEKVKRVKREKVAPTKLHDAHGAQTRWATPAESGDPWETPRDRVEEKLDRILGAVLVAEGSDAEGYYVPPQDVTTIAAHLVMFHAADATEAATFRAFTAEQALAFHAEEHRGDATLPSPHWHTKTRPRVAA